MKRTESLDLLNKIRNINKLINVININFGKVLKKG